MTPRNAERSEGAALARLWHRAWHEAHGAILPIDVVKDRTLSRLERRITEALRGVRVVGPPNEPRGFCLCSGFEVQQLFVASKFRGMGIAAALLKDAEEQLSVAGAGTAWLACAIGNERAANFYRKHGWSCLGIRTSVLKLADQTFPLQIWRFEKRLGAGPELRALSPVSRD